MNEAGARIAMIVPSLRGGGLERVVRDLALGVQARGYRPGVFAMTGLGVHEALLREAGIPLFDCRPAGMRLKGYPRRLIQSLRSFAPDLLHAHSGTWLPAAVAKGSVGGPPLVFTDHGRYPPEPAARAWIERWCLRRTDRLVAVSAALADYLATFLGTRAKALVAPNGIELAKYRKINNLRRATLRREWGVGPNDVLGLVVGRLAPVKNHSGIFRALAKARTSQPALKLAVLGTGLLEGDLRGEAANLGLEGVVIFLGYRDDVPDCLASGDFWVSASHTEGLPVALLEAMAAGLSIVSTAVGGIPETLGDPPAGLLVPPADEGELAKALARIAGDSALRNALGRRADERAGAYSVERMTSRYALIYSELLSRKAA